MNAAKLGRWFLFQAAMATLTLVCASVLSAAPPTLTTVSLRGLQIGETTELTLQGTGLLPNPRILLPRLIAEQKIVGTPTATQVRVAVTLNPAASFGIYPIRVATDLGISNPLAMAVDRLPQRPTSDEIELPVALSGQLGGGQIVRSRFAGSKGQRVVVEVEAARLGSKLSPVIRLLDPDGSQLAWSGAEVALEGDGRLEQVLPRDGQYTVEFHDRLHRSGGHYRLAIGDLSYAGLPYPLGLQRGKSRALTFLDSNLPADWSVPTEAPPASPAGTIWTGDLGARLWSGGYPEISLSPWPELTEAEATELPLPSLAISGRIQKAGEQDVFVLPVKPGMRLRLDVIARRVGSPLDGVLVVQGKQGNALAQNDDRPNTSDPGLDFTVPNKVEELRLAVRDLLGRGGDQFVYRLLVRDLAQPEMELTTDQGAILVPAGGNQVVKVNISRSGYQGPVQLNWDALPEGLQGVESVAPAGSPVALVSLTAAATSPAAGFARLRGTSTQEGTDVRRLALAPESVGSSPATRPELPVAVVAAVPIRLAWATDKGPDSLTRGLVVSLPVALDREPAATGPIRIRLLTSQIIPKKKIKKDNKDVMVDDLDRALRLVGKQEFAAGEKETAVRLQVPADLPPGTYQIAAVAELLTDDKKTVVASTSSLVQTIGVDSRAALALQLEGSPAGPLEAVVAAKEPVELRGKIERVAALRGPVSIQLEGLPKGVESPKVEVPAGQDTFVLPLSFPAGTKPTAVLDVKLTATAAADPELPNQRVASTPVALKLQIKAEPAQP